MKYWFTIVLFVFYSVAAIAQPTVKDNLSFEFLANRWDEAIPLGNGWLGALIWKKASAASMTTTGIAAASVDNKTLLNGS